MSAAPDDWGQQGRVARITAGEYAGRLLFAYPETVEPWWTAFVDPSFNDNAPGEMYFTGVDAMTDLTLEWGLEWLVKDEFESELEKTRFGIRPLTGPPSWLETPGDQ